MYDKIIEDTNIVKGIVYASARRCDDVLDLSLLDLEVGFDKVVDIEYLKDVRVLKVHGNMMVWIGSILCKFESLEEICIDGRNLNGISFARNKGCLMNLKKVVIYESNRYGNGNGIGKDVEVKFNMINK